MGNRLRKAEGRSNDGCEYWEFQCPGCGHIHLIKFGPNGWTWNSNPEMPTISPSILVETTQFTDKGEKDYDAWCAAGYPDREEPFDSEPVRCHSHIINGEIRYEPDSTHRLSSYTAPLPEF